MKSAWSATTLSTFVGLDDIDEDYSKDIQQAFADHAKLCSEVYLPPRCPLRELQPRVMFRSRKTKTYGEYHVYGDTMHIVFRGSVSARAWLTNSKVPLTPYVLNSHVKVHAGFNAIVEDLMNETGPQGLTSSVKDFLENCRRYTNRQPKVIVHGHSLGGAIAVLAAPYVLKLVHAAKQSAKLIPFPEDQVAQVSWYRSSSTPHPIRVYTCGTPRVGDDAFTAWYTALSIPTVRYTFGTDLLVSLPPRWLGYKSHVGIEVHLTKDQRGQLIFTDCNQLHARAWDVANRIKHHQAYLTGPMSSVKMAVLMNFRRSPSREQLRSSQLWENVYGEGEPIVYEVARKEVEVVEKNKRHAWYIAAKEEPVEETSVPGLGTDDVDLIYYL
ncbi:alpha/beta-hydrolase [Saitoella complicata NRRL Y-17804]|uniref:Fungal lipase-type domain-containing protein n=1 Tax=Saitoella complicata (strain BCRC 22490 / CBS 7301 / JCM 7358 / NBRC 10748 / NRRL Y-17804) TaxID=698492 RepID=A0A0E9NJK4_SAICN|nr:alpha/beta-hydrolase [Saitoella complicata NRRL Y-17804]ODQ51047.1 alpha/beta-hydrolase [Saitoella complicata NRRL Y-17804]GAO49585.1 hypothetical protein G7K_3734-t1 [Saitoella complicata NRRL Y-17804]